MPTIGPLQLAVILLIALMVFGPKRLPELARSIGSGLRAFRDSVSDGGGSPELGPQAPAATETAEGAHEEATSR